MPSIAFACPVKNWHKNEIQFFIFISDDKDQKKSQKILAELENIDDECDQNDIAFVKIDDDKEAKEYGIESIPTMVFFEKGIPHVYEGDLMKEDELFGWLLHQKRHSEIPEVTDEMMDKLIENTPYLAVIFCKYIFLCIIIMVLFDLWWMHLANIYFCKSRRQGG